MPRHLISSGSPFEKFAGYSRAVIDGDFAFIAGTTGYDYKSMTMPTEVTTQTRNCFATIEKVLTEAGFAMADIVRAVYYITDLRMQMPFSRFAAKRSVMFAPRRHFWWWPASTNPKC